MKKKIIFILVAVLLVASVVTYGVINYDFSKGVRSGRLVKISKKGILIKSYEGTLDLGSGDRLTWDFTVHDTDIGEELEKASGQMVMLQYRELFFKVFYNTKYDVTAWSIVEDKSSQALLCRLVKVMIQNKHVVDKVKSLIQISDPDLLELVRKCQQ